MCKLSSTFFSHFKFSKYLKRPLGIVLLLAGFLFSFVDTNVVYAQSSTASSSSGPLHSSFSNCKVTDVSDAQSKGHKACPMIVPHQDIDCPNSDPTKLAVPLKLEPSGLTRYLLNGKNVWIGVSDNFNDLYACNTALGDQVNISGYAVFYFEGKFDAQTKDVEYYHKKTNTRKTKKINPVYAYPLLTQYQAETINPYDLEGIEYDEGTETFYMTGSLSKHDENPHRDIWYRNQVYRFKVINCSPKMVEDDKNKKCTKVGLRAVEVDWMFKDWARDFRDWVLSNGEVSWTFPAENSDNCGNLNLDKKCFDSLANALTGRSEYDPNPPSTGKSQPSIGKWKTKTGERANGLNVEALAIAPDFDASELTTDLLFGLRGPIFWNNVIPKTDFEEEYEIHFSALQIKSDPGKAAQVQNAHEQVQLVDQLFIKNNNEETMKPFEFGFRGMTRLVEAGDVNNKCLGSKEIYAVILGHSGGAFDPLYTALIEVKRKVTGKVDSAELISGYFKKLPKNFVGEGIAVNSLVCIENEALIDLLLVEDLNARIMEIEFIYTP